MKERLTEEQIEKVEQEYDLPVVEIGSEKQIAWARAIRAEKLNVYAKRKEIEGTPYHNYWTRKEKEAAWKQTLSFVRSKVTARWWIDNREDESFLAKLCDALHPLLLEIRDERKKVRDSQRAEKNLKNGVEREKDNYIDRKGIVLRGYKYNHIDRAYKVQIEKELTEDETDALLRDGAADDRRVEYYCLYVDGKPLYVLTNCKGNKLVHCFKEE